MKDVLIAMLNELDSRSLTLVYYFILGLKKKD